MDNRKPAWIVNMYLHDGEYEHFQRSVAVFDTELEAQQHRDMCYAIQKDARYKDKFLPFFIFEAEKLDAYP